MNKSEVVARIEEVKRTKEGRFLPSDVVFKSFDGSDVAELLKSLGYTVVSNADVGRNGVAVTSCGVRVSTNGFVSIGIAEPNLYDFLSEAQAAELEAYAESCENYSESVAQYRNECVQFGDASFSPVEMPKLPDWYEDAYASFCKALDKWANDFDTEITEDDIPF